MDQETVLVTGASRGIGAAISSLLSLQGYRVIGTSRAIDKIPFPLTDVEYVELDLHDSDSIAACISAVGDIDVLINNVGQSHFAAAEEYPLDRTRTLFQNNLFGAIQLIQGFLPGMRRRQHGCIINIGSLVGKFAVPFQSGYVAAKFAVAGYTWALRNEVKPFGIRVVTVEPNDIRTDIVADTYLPESSPYKENISKVIGIRRATMKHAPPPEAVAEKVARILRKKNPRPFYTVGGSGPLMVFLKRLFPDTMVESLVRSNYGLN